MNLWVNQYSFFLETNILIQCCWNISQCGYFHGHFHCIDNLLKWKIFIHHDPTLSIFSYLLQKKFALWSYFKHSTPMCTQKCWLFRGIHFAFRQIFSITELRRLQFSLMGKKKPTHNIVNSNWDGVFQNKFSLFLVSSQWIYSFSLFLHLSFSP